MSGNDPRRKTAPTPPESPPAVGCIGCGRLRSNQIAVVVFVGMMMMMMSNEHTVVGSTTTQRTTRTTIPFHPPNNSNQRSFFVGAFFAGRSTGEQRRRCYHHCKPSPPVSTVSSRTICPRGSHTLLLFVQSSSSSNTGLDPGGPDGATADATTPLLQAAAAKAKPTPSIGLDDDDDSVEGFDNNSSRSSRNSKFQPNRRAFLSTPSLSTLLLLITTLPPTFAVLTTKPLPSWAAAAAVVAAESTLGRTTVPATTNGPQQQQQLVLASRVLENLETPPPYGLERPDIDYPPWFQGTWTARSTTTSVQAPCGVALFGSNATYAAAMQQVGTTLQYQCRFIKTMGGGEEVSTFLSSSSSSACIADRAYNVQSIAQAALGPYSIVDIPLATPNKLTAIMAPIRTNNNDSNNENSNTNSGLLQVDLFTVSRRQETIDATHFDCSEVVREIVSLARKTAARLVFKEIETTSLYSYNPTTQEISCRQRSASFLLPSQTDAVRMRQWERARGRPVDVRFYTVTYVPRRS